MSEISKLNIKTFKLPSDIDKFITLKHGYSIGISFYGEGEGKYIYLFKNEKDNFSQIQKLVYYGYPPIAYIQLKNKTLLTVGRNSLYFYKIKNDRLLRITCLNYDNNGDSLAEVIEVIEIENGKIILQNVLGDIFIVQKIKDYTKYDYSEIRKGYIINDNPEYEFIHTIPAEQRWKITPIIYEKNNTVFFKNFKIDFSNERYEKIKIKEYKVTKNKFNVNYRFEFENFILLELENSIYALIDKKYYEIITKVELGTINEIIHIDNNKYLCTFKDDKKKIFLLDLNEFNVKIIDSKEYNLNFKRKNEDQIFIRKYENQIFVLHNTI